MIQRPVAVRLGIWLLAFALLVNVVSSLWPKPEMTGIGGAATTFLIYGTLLYAMARRRNWARLIFLFLYVVGTLLSVSFSLLGRAWGASWNPVAVLWLAWMAGGLVCLFLPSATAWYHAQEKSVDY